MRYHIMPETRLRLSNQELALHLGGIVLSSGVIALMLYFSYQNMDTLTRRRSTANTISRLAAQYKNNPGNQAPLNAIIEHANGDYEFGRTYAVGTLGDLEGPPKKALPVLIRSLRYSDQTTAKEAAIALGRYGPAASEATPALMRALGDWEGADVSWFAAEALGKIGNADPKVVRALEKAAASQDPMFRENATEALEILRAVAVSNK